LLINPQSQGFNNNNESEIVSDEAKLYAEDHQNLRSAALLQQSTAQPPRLNEIVASPIYSESGGAPGRKFYVNVNNSSLGYWNSVIEGVKASQNQNNSGVMMDRR
jgi:hypothetical protein